MADLSGYPSLPRTLSSEGTPLETKKSLIYSPFLGSLKNDH
jgi:hypothetical protein